MNPKIIITGANGQLGLSFRKIAGQYPRFDFVFLTRNELAIDDPVAVREAFRNYSPSFCINCAAYTAVDKAETDRDTAYKINAEAVSNLASACMDFNCRFIHVSTDYVFDGASAEAYTEEAGVNPQNLYGDSKLQGERLALEYDPASIILRTSWVYFEEGKNFVNTMKRVMAERSEVNVVNDQFGSPTYAPDLAEAMMTIIQSGKWEPGIYHFSNTGNISWYDFAVAIKEIINCACVVNPIPTAAYPTPARRPVNSVMDKSKIAQVYGIELKDWKERLKVCLENSGQEASF